MSAHNSLTANIFRQISGFAFRFRTPAYPNDTRHASHAHPTCHQNDAAFSHPSSVKLPPCRTALFNSLPIPGTKRPYYRHTGSPPNISAPDLRDDGTCAPSFIYKTRFVRCRSSAQTVCRQPRKPQAPRRKWRHPRNPARCEYPHRAGVLSPRTPTGRVLFCYSPLTSWLWSRPG